MIEKVLFWQIAHLLPEAKKTGLTFCNSTEYYAFYHDANIVAITGLVWYKNKAVFKNSFVLPKHRGYGIYRTMFDFRLQLAKSRNIRTIEATCTKMSLKLWLDKGAVLIKQYKLYSKVQLPI